MDPTIKSITITGVCFLALVAVLGTQCQYNKAKTRDLCLETGHSANDCKILVDQR